MMFVIKVAFLGLWFISPFGCQVNKPSMPPQPDPDIEVILGEDIKSVPEVIKWPTYKDGRYQETRLVQQPSNLHLTLPSGRKLDYKVLNANLYQEDLRINSVLLRLPIMTAETQQAVANLENELVKLAPESRNKWADRIKDLLSVENDPNYLSGEQVGAFFDLEKGLRLRAGIETVLHKRDGRWVTEWITFLEFSFNQDSNKSCTP